jgi:hypothetical protein
MKMSAISKKRNGQDTIEHTKDYDPRAKNYANNVPFSMSFSFKMILFPELAVELERKDYSPR